MILGGLVSVTFRLMNVDEIIKLLTSTNLSSIEWGGDIHVPHGDIKCALDTQKKCIEAGLSIASYGSYYRVGHSEPMTYERILETALSLGAPVVRVWAGKQNSEDADAAYWHQVITDAQHIASLSAAAGLKIAFEYHGNTLTNTLKSTLKLLIEIDNDAVTSYWQAPSSASMEENIFAINALLPWLSNIHVNTGRKALNDPNAFNNKLAWQKYLNQVALTNRNHYALIEFVKNDSPAQFKEDADVLNTWLSAVNNQI